MTKNNYSAWQIDASDFSANWPSIDKLIFFANYATLAPSGHNSQPWELVKSGNNLNLFVNQEHHLSIDGSGLLSVEPYISLGTFIETFVLAARGFGYKIDLELDLVSEKIATIKLGGQTEPQPKLLDAIVRRVSNRNYYSQSPVNVRSLEKVLSGEKLASVSATVVIDKTDIEFLAEKTRQATISIMSNPLYRNELSQWVRTNQTRKYDGMPGFTHGFGNVKSAISKFAIKHVSKTGPQSDHSALLIKNSGALIIVRCQNNSKTAFINAGRQYSRICVFATEQGLSTSALGASVLDPTTRRAVKEHFEINDRPIYIIRLGKTERKARHSPRWPVEKILR